MRVGDPWSEQGAFVVFGAAGGAGAAVAQDLLDRGARVVLTVGTRYPLDTLPVSGPGRDRTRLQSCDVTDPSSVEEIMERAASLGRGRIAGVVLCTSSVLQKPAHHTLDAEWRQVMARNLDAAFYVTRAAARSMRNGGAVVFCAAAPDSGNHDALAAALAGIGGLTRSAAATYAHRGLRFNAIVPGPDRTGQPLGAAVDRAAAQTMARIAGEGDFAGAVRWLLDPANDWVTGHVLAVGYPSALADRAAGS